MNSKDNRYGITCLNWRDNTNRWEWHERYKEWLAIAELERPSHRRKPDVSKPKI